VVFATSCEFRKPVKKTGSGAGHARTRWYNPARFRGISPAGFDRKALKSLDARIAQLVEQRIENPRVGGSNPPPGTILAILLQT
jgi:hypothetical protein